MCFSAKVVKYAIRQQQSYGRGRTGLRLNPIIIKIHSIANYLEPVCIVVVATDNGRSINCMSTGIQSHTATLITPMFYYIGDNYQIIICPFDCNDFKSELTILVTKLFK